MVTLFLNSFFSERVASESETYFGFVKIVFFQLIVAIVALPQNNIHNNAKLFGHWFAPKWMFRVNVYIC